MSRMPRKYKGPPETPEAETWLVQNELQSGHRYVWATKNKSAAGDKDDTQH